ncbi:MAG: DHH family phosphoesterase, partial [Candidatus Heimdallarchaeota archaeon]|nr:DHH family phosphoesterase [Candidatus Heimdallarchaeota archaeon]
LLSSERPLFFFHDDADGLCSFLQFYKQVNRGKGVMVKSIPHVNERFYKVIENYGPDKIFVLDLAVIEQDFVNKVNKRIIWLDHHELAEIKGVKYYNPKQNIAGDNTCIAKLSYDIFKENLWISAVGTIGDWQLPEDMRKEILQNMPELLDKTIKTPEKALFETKFGKLAKMMNFILKGSTKEANLAVKVLTRINDPKEILEGSTEQGKFLKKRFESFNKEYELLLKKACDGVSKNSRFLVFTYEKKTISLTGELSNELLYRFPDKIIIIARYHNGEMKTSFRSGKNIKVRGLIEKAMIGIEGRFGGHEHACGGQVKDHDWNRFLGNMREAAKDVL